MRAGEGRPGDPGIFAQRFVILAHALRTVYWDKPHQKYWTEGFVRWAQVHHPEPNEERIIADLASVARTEALKLGGSRIVEPKAYAIEAAKRWTPGSFPGEVMARARMVYEASEQAVAGGADEPAWLAEAIAGVGK